MINTNYMLNLKVLFKNWFKEKKSSTAFYVLGILLVFCVYRIFQTFSQNLLLLSYHYLIYTEKFNPDKASFISVMLFDSVFWSCGIVLIVIAGLKLYDLSPEDIGWRKINIKNAWKILVGAISAPISCYLSRMFVTYMRYHYLPDFFVKTRHPLFTTLMSYHSLLFVTSIGVIVEELFFRGFVQTTLERKINFKYALVITSVLFTLTHSFKIHDWYIALVFIVYGLIYGLLKKWDGSLWSSIVTHGFFNFCLRWFLPV